MKIAVATMDGERVSQHFGQSIGFFVFDVEEGKILSCILRTPGDTPHNSGVCHGTGSGLDMLAGCQVLICGGMGGGAAAALQSAGVQPVLMPGVPLPQQAVALFLEGKGNVAEGGFCQCDHQH